MQLTKFLLEAETEAGTDIVLDFMQIESYNPVDKAGVSLIFITMSDGKNYLVKGNMTQMKVAAGQIGVPIYPLT
jgi:hypothetical protein